MKQNCFHFSRRKLKTFSSPDALHIQGMKQIPTASKQVFQIPLRTVHTYIHKLA
jgi:hypothetical protein